MATIPISNSHSPHPSPVRGPGPGVCRLAGIVLLVLLLGSARAANDRDVAFVDDKLERQPVNTVFPEYPERARRDRIEGEVTVCYLIDRQGKPHNVRVRRSTHRGFERPARRAVKASRYAPLADGESPSRLKSCRTFRFYLEPVAPPE